MIRKQFFVAFVLAFAFSISPAYACGAKAAHKGCHHMLSAAHAKLLHASMAKSFAQNKDLMAQSKALHGKLQETLAAKTFDQAQFLDLSAKLGALHGQMMTNNAKAFAAVAAKLTPEERKKMGEFGSHKMARGWGHGHAMGHHGMWKHGKKGCGMKDKEMTPVQEQKSWFGHLNQ